MYFIIMSYLVKKMYSIFFKSLFFNSLPNRTADFVLYKIIIIISRIKNIWLIGCSRLFGSAQLCLQLLGSERTTIRAPAWRIEQITEGC